MASEVSGYFLPKMHEWPIAYVALHGKLSDKDYQNYLDVLVHLPDRRQRFGLVLDGSALHSVSALQRQMSAAALQECALGLRRTCVGIVFIISNKLLQGALTAIFWLQPAPVEIATRGTVLEGVRWLAPRLKNAGLSLARAREASTVAVALQSKPDSAVFFPTNAL